MQETVIFDNMLTKVVIMGIPEKIKAIEDEIHKTQINKATEFHIGLLKAKIVGSSVKWKRILMVRLYQWGCVERV